MRIGVDLDNTIVCYDRLFYQLAAERGWIPPDLPAGKQSVRDYLRAQGQEPLWTELQGIAYGARIAEATTFAGVGEFFARCRHAGREVFVISHRTRYPFAGERVDLHDAARWWLDRAGLLPTGPSPAGQRIYLELTRQAKLQRIAALDCRVFIDDLPELLRDEGFPPQVSRILFDPLQQQPDHPAYVRATSWREITERLLGAV